MYICCFLQIVIFSKDRVKHVYRISFYIYDQTYTRIAHGIIGRID